MHLEIVRVVHNACSAASICLNILLVALIMLRTPNQLRSYSIVLFNFAIVESSTALASMFIYVRAMNTDDYMLDAVTGPCRLTGSREICFFSLAYMMHGHSQYCVLLGFGFCYRYYVMTRPTPRSAVLILALGLIYAPTIIVYIFYGSTPLLSVAAVRRVMAETYPAYDYAVRARSELMIGARMTSSLTLGILWVESVILPVYIVIGVVSYRLHRLLSTNLTMSNRSRRMHRAILKGLLLQSLLPTLYTVAVGTEVARANGLFTDWEEASYIAMTVGTVILAASPLITLLSIPPYRSTILSLFCKKVIHVNASVTDRRTVTINLRETPKAPTIPI